MTKPEYPMSESWIALHRMAEFAIERPIDVATFQRVVLAVKDRMGLSHLRLDEFDAATQDAFGEAIGTALALETRLS